MRDVIRQKLADSLHSGLPSTTRREFRALTEAMAEHPRAAALVLTATSTSLGHAQADAPKGIPIRPAWEWMLAESGT
jgi:hypothetical protein